MKNKRIERIEWTKEVIKAVGLTGLVAASFVAPNLIKHLGPVFLERREGSFTAIINQTVNRLVARGILFKKISSAHTFINLTEKGYKFLQQIEAKQIKLKRPKKWDEKWRIVIFDVEEKRKVLRDRTRETLRSIGFFRLQDSVWIFPYSADQMIELMRTGYGLRRNIIYLTSERFPGDYWLVRKFGLHRQ
ncbi:hypothetical protein HYT45_03485 [Candidatus Uhrbacteria bacterium]|nr:hypothetical protein [Candidatus Uhrbacteria bacterium]